MNIKLPSSANLYLNMQINFSKPLFDEAMSPAEKL
jgi:hypothetical protein